MLASVRKQIEQEKWLEPGETVLVGVSGGMDSTVLLHILRTLNEQYQYGWNLHVIHLNHGFRGEESRQDARYVEALCQEWGLPAHLYERDVSLYMKEQGLGAQEASRIVRYQLYQEVALQIGAAKVALAHHADDQVETVLFRLLRGSGLQGLGGIPARRWLVENRLEIVRPLMGCYRREIEAYCREAGLRPREDSSNRSRKYDRNRLRLDVFPLLESINERFREHIVQFAASAQIDEKYLRAASEKALSEVILEREPNRIGIAGNKFQSCDLALQSRMITLILSYLSSGIDWSSQHVEAVLRIITEKNPSARLDLPSGIEVQRMYDRTVFCKRVKHQRTEPYCYALNIPGITVISESGVTIRTALLPEPPDLGELQPWEAVLDANRVNSRLMVRNRREGDRLTLLGSGGTKKLKDVLIDAKVPKAWRDRLPLLVADQEIIWVPGVRRAAAQALPADTTRCLYVRVEYGEDWREVFR